MYREDLALQALQAEEAAAKVASNTPAAPRRATDTALLNMGLIGDVAELAATDRDALNSDVPLQLHQPPQAHPKNIGTCMSCGMYVCLYVCMYVCVYVCMYVCVCMHACVCMSS